MSATAVLRYDKLGRPIADNHGLKISDYLKANNKKQLKAEQPKEKTARAELPAYKLILKAIGSPAVMFDKFKRFCSTLFMYINVWGQRRRLQRLKDMGYIETIPSQKQLWIGALDMLRFFIKPGAESYLKSQGLSFSFHQLLRILNDPASMTDPIGIRVPRDTIICHLLEVVHANPVYDFQLLDQFEDGLDELDQQTRQMIDGTHSRYGSISAITEDNGYHQRLLGYLQAYRKDPLTKQMIRQSGSVRDDKYFILAEATYGTLPSVFRYISRLPNKWLPLLKHFFKGKHINPVYCDDYIVEDFNKTFAP